MIDPNVVAIKLAFFSPPDKQYLFIFYFSVIYKPTQLKRLLLLLY